MTATRHRFAAAALFALCFPLAFLFAGAPRARADGLAVTPAVIDDTGLPRDILNYTLTVTNGTARQENVFASVYNLTAAGAQSFVDASSADRPASLANWISVSRAGMVFAPGETKTVPVTIQINPFAVAGDYHAVIAFVTGGTRAEAETHLDGAPQAIVNIKVESNAKEELQIAGFAPEARLASAFPVSFSYTIANTGDVSSTPAGSVIIYDNIGHELQSLDANPDDVAIAPGEKRQFSVTWSGNGGYGQYKAMLDLSYGASGATLESAALVWVLPWQKIALIFGLLFIIVVAASSYLYKRYEKRHNRRLRELERAFRKAPSAPQVIDLRHPDRHPPEGPGRPS